MRTDRDKNQPSQAVYKSLQKLSIGSLWERLTVRIQYLFNAFLDAYCWPVDRNAEFLTAMKWHTEWVFSNAFLIHAVPWVLRPLLGNLI